MRILISQPLTLLGLLLLILRPAQGHNRTLYSEDSLTTLCSSDRFCFGQLWPRIRQQCQTNDLYDLIAKRRRDISAIKESWRPFITKMNQENTLWQERTTDFYKTLSEGKLIRSTHGSGSAYFLLDASHKKRYVVKPIDEDMLCLNNSKQRASPFLDAEHRVRDAIPLYETAPREMLASAIASHLQIPEVTPWVIVAIVRSEVFYDISEALEENARQTFIEQTGLPDQEKLCTIQPFLPDTIELGEAMHEWFEANNGHSKELLPFHEESFENTNLFVWAIYDCDGHGGNFLLYLHSLDSLGRAIYGLKKIDNGLCFPTANKHLNNYLAYAPNAKVPPSLALREKIASIDIAFITRLFQTYGLQEPAMATETRLTILQELATWDISMEEINHRMELLALPHGQKLALTKCSREELEQLAIEKSDSSSK